MNDPDITIEYVDSPERDEIPTEPTIKERPESPKLNRAQRRQLQRYIAHKAALQIRHVYKKRPDLRKIDIAQQKVHCKRCGNGFIASTAHRCQCQVQQHHACAMCYGIYIASQQERRFTNICAECAIHVQSQRLSEAASRDEAARRADAQREWDEEEHRKAREGE